VILLALQLISGSETSQEHHGLASWYGEVMEMINEKVIFDGSLFEEKPLFAHNLFLVLVPLVNNNQKVKEGGFR
jgi:hypothetical protein